MSSCPRRRSSWSATATLPRNGFPTSTSPGAGGGASSGARGGAAAEAEEWAPEDFPLPEAVRDALFVNLLTEDNLPYYFHTIDNVFGRGVWGEWIRRWAAEEQRHSIVIRDYLMVTRALDPVELERGRMAQVAGAVVPEPDTPEDTLVYVALQELATRGAQ